MSMTPPATGIAAPSVRRYEDHPRSPDRHGKGTEAEAERARRSTQPPCVDVVTDQRLE